MFCKQDVNLADDEQDETVYHTRHTCLSFTNDKDHVSIYYNIGIFCLSGLCFQIQMLTQYSGGGGTVVFISDHLKPTTAHQTHSD